jgi:NAD(P)-dependent dehydrogenase (short-subunit alcohol dehydrogenase family)
MHLGGDPSLTDLQWSRRGWNASQAYSDSKLRDVLLAFAVVRLWFDALSNAMMPGWVATRMVGPGAPDDLDQAHMTQAWLAASEDPGAAGDWGHFYHKEPGRLSAAARSRAARPLACPLPQRLRTGVCLMV